MNDQILDSLEQKFNLAEKLVDELSTLVEDDIPLFPVEDDNEFTPLSYCDDETTNTEQEDFKSIISVSQMKMDFQLVRKQLQAIIISGNNILKQCSILDLSDVKGSTLQALAQLQSALGTNITNMVNIYRQIADIEKIREPKTKALATPTDNNLPSVNGNMTQNNFYVGSSADLLKVIEEQQKKVIEV